MGGRAVGTGAPLAAEARAAASGVDSAAGGVGPTQHDGVECADPDKQVGDYPWQWSIVRWLPGENAYTATVSDPIALAGQLAEFVLALRAVDLPGGPPAKRGVPLAQPDRDARVRAALTELAGVIDSASAASAWEDALAAPQWAGPPVWVHGDLLPGNLLLENGKLSAVIDFGGLGVGDPACDLFPAWTVLSGEARTAFREAVNVDDATWARGRGWALCFGLVALPYYVDSNPVLASIARRAIDEVLADRT